MKKIIFLLFFISTVDQARSAQWDHIGSFQRGLIGPAFSTEENPDFIISRGILNGSYYNYKSTSHYSGCALKTQKFSFGTKDSSQTRVDLRVLSYIHWIGSEKEFHKNSSFTIKFEGKYRPFNCVGSDCLQVFELEHPFDIKGLKNVDSYNGELNVYTNAPYSWLEIPAFTRQGMLEDAQISVCNLAGRQDLQIHAIEMSLSHEL